MMSLAIAVSTNTIFFLTLSFAAPPPTSIGLGDKTVELICNVVKPFVELDIGFNSLCHVILLLSIRAYKKALHRVIVQSLQKDLLTNLKKPIGVG